MKLIKKEKLKEKYDCWDLTVKRSHNYVIEGIVVHNSNSRTSIGPDPDDTEKVVIKAGSHKVKRKRPDNFQDMQNNIYWHPYTLDSVKDLLEYVHKDIAKVSVTLYGEVYGRIRGGHKSMHYGKPNSLNYTAFALKIDGKYVNWDIFKSFCDRFKVPTVPVIAVTEFNMEEMKKLSVGPSILAKENGADHMREGIVICSVGEREEWKCSRAILKMLNQDYLILKNKKEAKGDVVDFKDE